MPELTPPQRLALLRFEPGEWRGAHPDINARTTLALASLGLLEARILSGRRIYRLNASCMQVRDQAGA